MKKFTFLLNICTIALFSCNSSHQESATQTVVLDSNDKLWDKRELNVCWLNSGPDTQQFRLDIEEFVTKNFEATVLTLSGWEPCNNQASSDEDIRVLIFDGFDSPYFGKPAAAGSGHPRVLGFGKELRQKTPGVILTMNFTAVQKSLTNVAANLDSRARKDLLLSVSLHEFGHAIGLYHENTHPDSNCIDSPERGPRRAVTDFVQDSMMNRCYYRNANYNDGPLSMSKGDIDGINKAYEFLF